MKTKVWDCGAVYFLCEPGSWVRVENVNIDWPLSCWIISRRHKICCHFLSIIDTVMSLITKNLPVKDKEPFIVPLLWHHMSVKASQITGNSIVCTTVCLGQRKRQSQHYWPLVWGIHRLSVDSLHKGSVMRQAFPCHVVVMHSQLLPLITWCLSSRPWGRLTHMHQ